MKKQLALLLALLMCLPAVSSCSESSPSGETDAPVSQTVPDADESAEPEEPEEPETTRADYPDTLPELDFGGETVVIHTRGDSNATVEIYSEEMNGQPINDAIYERNELVSERLGVVIEPFIGSTWTAYDNDVAAIRSSIMSNSAAFDIVAGWSARIPALSLECILHNLNTLPHLNLSQPWWTVTDELDIGGQIHFVTGDVATSMLASMCIYLFNHKVANDLSIENLYDVVRDHKWTVDYIHTLTSGLYRDLNGNGSFDESDFYGLTTSSVNDADGYMQGFRVSMVSRDEEGYPVLDVNMEHLTTVVEKLYNLNWNNTGCWCITGDGTSLAPFVEDRTLLSTSRVTSMFDQLANMESDYGVLPYPLLNEAQENYGTRVQDSVSLWCVPIDVSSTEKSGAVLEALSAQSYRTVTPEYFDVALKSRYSRDPDTAEMMDLVKDSIYFNFESLYNETIATPWYVLRDLMPQKSTDFASYWKGKEKQVKRILKTTAKELKENMNQ